MFLFIGAVIAGVLTTLAPCVLPLLPVIVGGSLVEADNQGRRRAFVIVLSLGISVVLFTLLLKVSTSLLGVPPSVWQWVSGLILIAVGIFLIYPQVWEKLSMNLSLQSRSSNLLQSARKKEGLQGSVLTGAALGPVFSSCSPFYGFVIVTVMPASFGQGLFLLMGYVLGLCATLLLIVLLGQKFLSKAKWISNPEGWFRRIVGIVFILVAIVIILGLDKEIQIWVLENSPIRPWELDTAFIPNQ